MASTTGWLRAASIIAIARADGALHYHRTISGADGGGGVLDVEAIGRLRAADAIVVVRDPALLTDPALRPLLSPPMAIGLLPPSDRRDESAEEVATAASVNGGAVALLTGPVRGTVEPYLREVGRASRLLDDLDEHILGLAENASPEYTALLRHGRRLRANASAVLRRHPSPRTLLGDSPRMLSGLLSTGDRLNDHMLVERLVRIGSTAYDLPDSRGRVELAERVIPGLAAVRDSVARQVGALQHEIYRLADPSAPNVLPAPSLMLAEGLPLSVASAGMRLQSSGQARPVDPDVDVDELVERCRAASRRRREEPCASQTGYLEYRAARAALGDTRRLDPVVRAEVELHGQLLAADCSDFTAESGYSAAVLRALAELPEERRDDEEARRVEADSELIHAIAGVNGVDWAGGFPPLRAAVSNCADHATPSLLLEARGTLALVLGLYGELADARSVIASVEAAAADCPDFHGAARAAVDVARLLTTGSAFEDEALVAAREQAARTSAGTAMAPCHEYVVMLTSYVAKDPDAGLAAYERLHRESERYPVSQRLERMATYSFVLLQTAVGNLSAARAGLSALRASPWFDPGSTDSFLQTLVLTRLRLAAGNYDAVLAATAPDGPLSECGALRMQARYAPACLALRAAALAVRGGRETAAALFRRAFTMSAAQREYFALLGSETPEMRAWLSGLAPEELPPGMTPEMAEGILRRALYVELPVPQLTKQERQVLFLLSSGRSAASIATELTVSSNTLKTHLRQIYRKLGVTTRKEAVVVADERGLLL